MVDLQTALNLALTLVAFLGGWLLRSLKDDIQALKQADMRLQESVNDLRVELPTHYVPKPDFKEMGDKIFSTLRRIEEKIDQKADKE